MEVPEKNIALLCNPTHENAKALGIINAIEVLLKAKNIRYSIFVSEWPIEWNNSTEVWIIGGDGTLNYFINQYPNIQLPLSVFAGGSGNDFQWMMYENISVEQQVKKILEAQPQFIDAGSCNGKLFLNGVGIGFDGAIVKDLLGKKKLAAKASYLLSILKHLAGYHEKPCELQMTDKTISQDCFMISVANGKRYGGGFMVAPKASLTDEYLDINIVGRVSPLKRLKYLPVIEKGEHLELPFVQYYQTRKIKITSPVLLPAHLDGEYLQSSSFEIEILPKRFSFLF